VSAFVPVIFAKLVFYIMEGDIVTLLKPMICRLMAPIELVS